MSRERVRAQWVYSQSRLISTNELIISHPVAETDRFEAYHYLSSNLGTLVFPSLPEIANKVVSQSMIIILRCMFVIAKIH